MDNECRRCQGHKGFFKSYDDGYEYCGLCRDIEYRNQKVKITDGTRWVGWNIENGPLPEDLKAMIPVSFPKISVTKPISTIGYKFVRHDLTSLHGKSKPWKLFNKFYLDNKKPIKLCSYGFHSSDTPYAAYSYVSTDILLKVERLGDMIEDKTDFKHKVVSRGLKVLSVVWVGDVVSLYQDRVISEAQFNEYCLKRINKCAYRSGYGYGHLKDYANKLLYKPEAINSVIKELDRVTRVKRS